MGEQQLKKAQVSMEFVFLVGLAFMVMIVFISSTRSEFSALSSEEERSLVKDVAVMVQHELVMASNVEDGYIRIFEVPLKLDNSVSYDIQIAGNIIITNTTEYEYVLKYQDPLGTEYVYYYIEWGNGNYTNWIGPYESGKEISIHHSWNHSGLYNIKAKCKNENDVESEWSDQLIVSMYKGKSNIPFGSIFTFGFDVDVKIVQLEPGENYVDLEVLSKPFYIWENGIQTRNPGEFIRLYNAKGLFSPSLPFCFGICDDWGIIG